MPVPAWISSAREIYSTGGHDAAPLPATLCHLHCPWIEHHQWGEAWLQLGQAQSHLSKLSGSQFSFGKWFAFRTENLFFPVALFLYLCLPLLPCSLASSRWQASLCLLVSKCPEQLKMMFSEQYLLWTIYFFFELVLSKLIEILCWWSRGEALDETLWAEQSHLWGNGAWRTGHCGSLCCEDTWAKLPAEGFLLPQTFQNVLTRVKRSFIEHCGNQGCFPQSQQQKQNHRIIER